MVLYDNFLLGTYDDGGVIPDNTDITVDYGSHTVDLTFYDENDIDDGIEDFVISLQIFRDTLGLEAKKALDRLQGNIENDTVFLELCPNVTALTLETYRELTRIVYVDFYTHIEGINIADAQVQSGLDLFVAIGLLDIVDVNRLKALIYG
jgi:hypothetical protein